MFQQDKEYIVIAPGEEDFKIVHLKTVGGKPFIVDVVKKSVSGVAEEELPKMIRSALEGMPVRKVKSICIVRPGVVTTKNIEIPSLDPAEIKSIIDLQAGRHTPYSREEILIGYITIGVFQRNYTKVLLIIVNREVVRKQLDILAAAGLRIDRVLFAPEGIARFYAQDMGVKEEDPPLGIIDIAAQNTNFIIEFNRTVATCRNIAVGLTHLIKEGAAAQERLVAEILKSAEAYQSEDIHKMPETYYLTSDDAKIKELQPVLQEKLKAIVKVSPYLDRIQAAQPTMLKFISEYNDDSFLDVVAAGGTAADVQVDLIPDEIKMQRALQEKGRQMVTTGICVMLLILVVCAKFFADMYFKAAYLSDLEREYTEKQRAVAALDRIAEKTRIVKDYVNSRMASLDVLRELYDLTPDDIYLQSIALDEKGDIAIQGIAESPSLVFEFNKALKDSDFFKGATTKSTTPKKERGKDVTGFEIVFKLESAKDVVEKAEAVEGEDGEEGKDEKKK
ncbi:MAG: pilus assembly protein PilM [Candidatus Omnitrophota bacterium]|nr:pilus assembly protein PilM [Candidatus Omnitrophota bacterium]MDZ4243320.1 pilus assembly protein PilM [Candidatus Omnitrophota bacterium]